MSGNGNIPGKPKGALHPTEQKRSSGTPVLGDLVKAETMIQLAIALPIGCVVGWLLGSLVDHHYGTRYGGVTGIVIGAIGGFIKIFQTAQKYMKDNN